MSFQVYRSAQNNTTIIHLIDNNHSTAVSIIPDAGALLHEFKIPVNGKAFNIIENYSLDKPPAQQVTHYFRSVKLSPWVCRLARGRYQLGNQSYQVEKMYTDGTALHGLLFDQPFEVVDQFSDDACAWMLLRHHYTGADAGYPFSYDCEVKYTLHPGQRLEVETTIINTSGQSIPMADGWHPYFRLGGRLNGWELQFEAEAMLAFDDKLIPTGKLLPYDHFNQGAVIGDTIMDNCFLLKTSPGQPACTVRNPGNNIRVSLFADAGYPYLQIFIPDHRESIAIENISSAPDSFNNGMGLTMLEPGNSQQFRVFYLASVEENS
jgi:aldose 1-epimerase